MTLTERTKAIWKEAPWRENGEVIKFGWWHRLYRLTPANELFPGEQVREQTVLYGCQRRTAWRAAVYLQRLWQKVEVTHCSDFVVFRAVVVVTPEGKFLSRKKYEDTLWLAEWERASQEHEKAK